MLSSIKRKFKLSIFLVLLALPFYGYYHFFGEWTPSKVDNICQIFEERPVWYVYAKRTEETYGIKIPVLFSIIRHESSFRPKAKPPRKKLFWKVPHWDRLSSAYGYAQAIDGTWKWYLKSFPGKERDVFADAVTFVGWYNSKTHTKNKIAKEDAYNLYLAYHEGQGGYARGTYKKNKGLQAYAKKVEKTSLLYTTQLRACSGDIESSLVFNLLSI